MQFGLYYGGVLGLGLAVGEEKTTLTTVALSVAQTFWGLGLMMHTEHLKINQQSGSSKAGFPLKLVYDRYRAGGGHQFRYGTPALFFRELLFMIPMNVKHYAEDYSDQLFAKAGFTSPGWKSFSKWPGTFGIFFLSGVITSIPDSLNSNLKNDNGKIHKIGELIKTEVKERGTVGFLRRYNSGAFLRGLTIAISATATFVCVDFYKKVFEMAGIIE
jgi:hypothetical protein